MLSTRRSTFNENLPQANERAQPEIDPVTRNPLVGVLAALILFAPVVAHGATLTASWVDNSFGVARTKIERRLGTEGTFKVIASLPPGVTAYVDSTVRSGERYCYRAFAYNHHGASPYSDEACGVAVDQLNVTVGKAGNGAGTVTSTPAGISCGTVCSAAFPARGAVSLSATPNAGSRFLGWSGSGCTGTQPCSMAGNAAVAVTANFGPALSSPIPPGLAPLSARCTVAAAQVGVPYSGSCTATGGAPPYSCTVTSGALPLGLSLTDDCRIIGTPATPGTTSFTARVTDNAHRVGDASGSVSVLPRPTITTLNLPRAVLGRAFSTALVATGGRAPYSWAVVGGQVPAGLALDPARGTIAGVPTALGVSTFTIRVRDALGANFDRRLQHVVNQGPLTATCVTGPAELGVAFFDACEPRAGLPPYACVVAGGTLPPGLMLNTDCTLRGVPAMPGTGSFRARVSDSGGMSVVVDGHVVVQPHVAVTTATVPYAVANRSYSTILAAAGGVRPYRWMVSGGSLPHGLMLDAVSGDISGRPTDVGVTTAVLRVTDALGASDERPVMLVVHQGPLTAACRPAPAEVGVPYASSVLPAGLALNSDCTITGTPTAGGGSSFTTLVRDSGGLTINVGSYILTHPHVGITTAVLPYAIVKRPLPLTLVASGGTPPYT